MFRISRRFLTNLNKTHFSEKIRTAVVIDVRNFSETDEGVIKADKLIHIPLGEVQEALQLDSEDFLAQYNAEKPKVDDELVFYCMAGVRSKSAALQFEQAGYSDVSNYLGGWWEWNSDWNKENWLQWSQKTGFPLNPKLLEQL